MKYARQLSVWGAVLVMAFTVALGPPAAQGATEAAKQTAIDNGLAYLAGAQQADGRWNFGDDNSDTAATGAALLAFIEEGHSAGTNVVIGATDYGDVVGDGLNWLMTRATVYNITPEPAGNPDSDGNGIGIKFVPGGNNQRDTYVTGLALPPIAASGTPNKLVTTGPLVGRADGSGAGGAWTYKDVVQNTVDYNAYAQADSGWARGGWRYYADYGQADNSTAQWPIIGSLYASSMTVGTPGFVGSELKHWISFIQNPANGGSYYDNNFLAWGSNMSRTGALLIEMAYAGYPGSGAAPVGGTYASENAAYQAALAYVNSQWNTYANATWNGNFNHPYAMWAVYKGLEVNIGLGDATTITPRAQGGAVIDPGDVWNWWEDYCEWLVIAQNANGSWNGYGNWSSPLATPWHINILNATHIPPPPPIPEPVTAVGLFLGVGCLARYVRRRRSR